MNLRDQMEGIYRDLPPGRIPWNLEQPPELLADLVHSGRIRPCDAIDIGCGAGNYTVWLATLGFRMTGMDISPTALELAGQLAREKGVTCRFLEEDITGDTGEHEGEFDFGVDWELLHHVFPEKRGTYVSNVHRMLRPGATYLSVCLSDRDRDFGGKGKYRKTPLGTTLYFSSEEEIERVFVPKFKILELDTADIVGKYGPHAAIVALLECK
jgi:SAM-dependent methyltransferase